MLTRLATLLMAATLAGTAQAEPVGLDREFGLFAPDETGRAADGREAPIVPSLAAPSGTEIIIGGTGRFGLLYEDYVGSPSDVTLSTRLRVDVDITHETDSGVVLGAKVRAQGDAGSPGTLNAPQFSATWD